jgi:hypothetical protein
MAIWAAFACLIMLAGCGTPEPQPHFKIGQPYKINGTWYHPQLVTPL